MPHASLLVFVSKASILQFILIIELNTYARHWPTYLFQVEKGRGKKKSLNE